MNAPEMAATMLNRKILYNNRDRIVLNPNVGKTPQNAPIAAPNAIS